MIFFPYLLQWMTLTHTAIGHIPLLFPRESCQQQAPVWALNQVSAHTQFNRVLLGTHTHTHTHSRESQCRSRELTVLVCEKGETWEVHGRHYIKHSLSIQHTVGHAPEDFAQLVLILVIVGVVLAVSCCWFMEAPHSHSNHASDTHSQHILHRQS